MKVYKAFLNSDRVNEGGVAVWVNEGQVVDIGGQKFVEVYGTLYRDLDAWHPSRLEAEASCLPSIERVGEVVSRQIARLRAAKAAGSGPSVDSGDAGAADPGVAW